MIWKDFDEIRRREKELQRQIYNILHEVIKKYSFNGVTFKDVKWEWEIDRRKADLVILDKDDNPFLIIETKRKIERAGEYIVKYSFHVTDLAVIGQAISYAALAKKNGLNPQFVATCNPIQIAIFRVPDNIDKLVNWTAIKNREYDKVIPPELYRELIYGEYRFDTRDLEINERFFIVLLEDLVNLVKKIKKIEDIAPFTFKVIRDLRGFVNWLAYNIEPKITEIYKRWKEIKNGKGSDCERSLIEQLEKLSKEKGYEPSSQQLAKEMAYVFMNKLIFYKILERYWGKLPKLNPLLSQGIKSATEYLKTLNNYFTKAVEVTKNFEPVFITGIYDLIILPDDPEILRGIDEFIRYLEGISIEKFTDVIGYVYEELIPAEERHILGEFYTPPPIAELIVKWCIRTPDDTVLDPGCGSGTFLVQAYKYLHYLKIGKTIEDVRYPKKEVHERILEQLYAIDINEFPAHLTAINLAMRNPRAPSTKMNVIVSDFFSIIPCQEILPPYRMKVLEQEWKGELTKKVHVPQVDCVVGNPPYTRWGEIPEKVQRNIIDRIGELLSEYNLRPQIGRRGAEYTMVVFWLVHATNFLKEHGRLGMIVSDSWLQTDYGIKFSKFLADHYKIHAIIDISARVFPVPLIGTCIILLEKCENAQERDLNDVVLAYLEVKERVDIDRVLEIVNKKQSGVFNMSGARIVVNVYRQEEIKRTNDKLINLLFNIKNIKEIFLEKLAKNKNIIKLNSYFDVSYGNTLYTYLYTKRIVKTRHAGVGGEEFFYLTKDDAQRLDDEYVYPLLPSPRYMNYFTFTKKDWDKLCNENKKCFLFLAHKPRNLLPENILSYIERGETVIKLKRGIRKGEPVSKARAAEERRRLKKYFYDWYDLGGVIEAPIYATYGAQYWIRFVLAEFKCALDHRILALIPKEDVKFNELELKALLAYLNSSFSQLQAEIRGRSTGGGMIELDVRPLSEFLVLDVKKLSEDQIKRLAQLFDKLEEEARKLGGADTVESIFGSELARELTGVEVKPNIEGLWNTVIKEIDYEIAKILGMEETVEYLRTILLELIKRRLARAKEPKPEALKGTEELPVINKEKRKSEKKTKKRDNSNNFTLDAFFK